MSSGLGLFIGLFSNLAILVLCVAAYGFILDRFASRSRRRQRILLGIAFGLFVIGSIQMGIRLAGGVLVDQRDTVVILAGAFGGPISAVVAASVGAAFLAALGGQGVYGGLLGLGLSVVAGSLLGARRRRIDGTWKGVIAALAASAFVLPGFLASATGLAEGWGLIKSVALPYGSATAIGVLVGWILLAREERWHETQRGLRESEAKYRGLLAGLPDMIYRIDGAGRLEIISSSCEAILGYTPEELIGKTTGGNYSDPSRFAELRALLARGEPIDDFEAEFIKKDGTKVAVAINARVQLDESGRMREIDGVLRDVTLLKRTEDALRASLAERETLLMELFHRINNNMQVISSFLKIQAEALDDPKVDSLAQSVSSRIHAMSLVYEKLYRSKNLSRINGREYIEELVPLIEAYGSHPDGKVLVEVEAEDIEFLVDSAVPLGLVVSEIVGNAFKHAFPGELRGTIKISLRRLDEATVLLEISDDGVGLPPGFDPYTTTSFGISTMLSIVRLQMRGDAEVRNGKGLSYRIRMRDRLYEERV
jgi:PAS domain S-box-containing protein